MSSRNFPFAARLLGFSPQEREAFEKVFAMRDGRGYGYICLEEDNLRDPDLYIANADQLNALVNLTALKPSDLRPALLVGTPAIEMPFPWVERPVQWPRLFEALDGLIERRADALSRLEASDIVIVPERRRRPRLDIDLTDPAEYIKMRAKRPETGMVLIIDRNPAFREHLAGLLERHKVPVGWADSEAKALESCQQQPTAMVMINTSMPDVDPYRLCRMIQEQAAPTKITVIFLVGEPFVYDAQQAREAGVEGFLNKPLAAHHLMSAMRKFLPLSR